MATLSIGKAWEETAAFVAREAALLLPVALLFVALPIVLLQEMTPPELVQWSASMKGTMPAVPGSYWFSLLLAVVLIWFGSLTLFALALRPGISVAEALRLALHRLPVLIGDQRAGGAVSVRRHSGRVRAANPGGGRGAVLWSRSWVSGCSWARGLRC